MKCVKNFYAWLFCAFAALGACLYGYDGVYFTGVSAIDAFVEHFGERQSDGTHAIAASRVFFFGSITVIVGVVLQLATDHKHSMIIGGRILLGYRVGNFSATYPLYLREIAPTRIRGPLLMCWQLVLSISQIVAAAINRGTQGIDSTVSYRVPMNLLRKNKVEAARKSLQSVNRDDKSYTTKSNSQDSSWMDLILGPIERRKTIYSARALIAQQVNGIQWFYYFGTVFSKAIGLSNPFLMILIVFIIQVVAVLCAVFCANKLPRRSLLLITTSIMGVSIFVVGCLGFPGGEVSPTFGKVIISFVIIEITAFNFAWGPLAWTTASEMAVGRNRDKIYAVVVACFWVQKILIDVIINKRLTDIYADNRLGNRLLPYLYYSANLGPKIGFVYTGLCVISFAYFYFCVGEVSGRSMEEINRFFMNQIPARKWRDQPRPAIEGCVSRKNSGVNEKSS
ncbi:hypothetical protein BDV29DRAFT_200400 [Aspergillus leporis]|uniref:Major facilitator superfamily (MFS) profile domain-containing protein n=1 Tax=Aspergillus leporis TaxID=41062 RepID=A0A5N5X7V0_9EURO|nr:hypothetical protein BDV29DRAFT_200400 [Aspergillus leporis]